MAVLEVENVAVVQEDLGTFLVADASTLDELVSEGREGVVAIDIETTGLDPLRGTRVRLVQLCGEAGTVVLDLGLEEEKARYRWWVLAKLLGGCRLVAHNAVFEGMFLWEAGWRSSSLGRLEDTMLANAALFTRKRVGQGLADVVGRVLGVKLDKELQKSNWDGKLTAEQVAYARKDAEVTWRLWKALEAELDRTGIREGYELLRGAVPAIIEMQMVGICFDLKEHDELCVDLGKRFAKAEAACRDWCGVPDVENLNSGPQISGWIVREWPALASAWPETERGSQLSLTAETVSVMVEGGVLEPRLLGFLKAYQGRCEVSALLNSFGPSLGKRVYQAEKWEPVGGRIRRARPNIQDQENRLYASFMINGAAATGRMSSKRPNMQNQPARKYPEFRRIFKASPGHRLIIADYAQIEVRVGALLSGQDDLLDRLAAGTVDIHTLMASDMFKVSLDAVTKQQRGQAKGLTFGIQYGMQVPSLSKVLGCSEGEAREFLIRWEETYPKMAAQRTEWRKEAGRTKCLMTAGGRRLMCGSNISPQQAANYPVQAGAADVMYAALWEFMSLRRSKGLWKKIRPLLVVHDELVVEAEKRHVDACVQLVEMALIKGFLRVFPKGLTPNLVDTTVAADWSEKGEKLSG